MSQVLRGELLPAVRARHRQDQLCEAPGEEEAIPKRSHTKSVLQQCRAHVMGVLQPPRLPLGWMHGNSPA